MGIPDIKDPNLFQRLVRKLMICEHGSSYQVVDDSGGDGGLDGFNRSTGELRAIYCPEKHESTRFRRKFQTDLEKAVLLRDEKHYPIKQFIFVTPRPMREPDQRLLRDVARNKGFEDGININGEHLEALFARYPEIAPQFPELSYPKLEQKLNRVVSLLEGMENPQGSADSGVERRLITGFAAQILVLTVRAVNRSVRGAAESDDVIQALGITAAECREALEELEALGLLELSKNINHPSHYARCRIRPGAFVQVVPQVLDEIDIMTDLGKLLQAFASAQGEYVVADEILKKSSVPVPRAQILIDFLEEKQLIETSGMGYTADGPLFYYGRILPLGKRVLEGKDSLPLP